MIKKIVRLNYPKMLMLALFVSGASFAHDYFPTVNGDNVLTQETSPMVEFLEKQNEPFNSPSSLVVYDLEEVYSDSNSQCYSSCAVAQSSCNKGCGTGNQSCTNSCSSSAASCFKCCK